MTRGRLIGSPLRVAALSTLILLISALFQQPELRQINPAGAPDPAVQLTQAWGYLLMAPLCKVLDMLTLLGPWQHLQLWAGIAAFWIAGRWIARLSDKAREPVDWAGSGKQALTTIIVILLIYAGGGLLPRPMESLAVSDPDIVKVDFHSHTQASHDGRPRFGAEENRAWHRAAGFDAAYISDHGDWTGVDEALRNNPALAGEGTVLLEAREFALGNARVIGLGDRELYKFALKKDSFDAREATRRYGQTGTWPVLIFTIPGSLSDLERYADTDLVPYSAVEISDGAPRGLEQGWRDRNKLLALSFQYDLSLIASSNNHGWGRTAAAWTLISVPGWRRMTPAALSMALQQRLADGGRAATVVVERRLPAPAGAWYTPALLLPTLAGYLLTTLTLRERLMWMLYLWIGAVLLTPGLLRIPGFGGARQPHTGAIAASETE